MRKSPITQIKLLSYSAFDYFSVKTGSHWKYGIDYFSEPYKEVYFLMDELEQYLGYARKNMPTVLFFIQAITH